jgi:transcriptional regulator with XRE-family HTH domain
MEDPNFSGKVRELRAQAGVGREVIAKRANVAVNTVRNTELGHNVTVLNLRRVLLGMGYDLQIVPVSESKPASRLKAS